MIPGPANIFANPFRAFSAAAVASVVAVTGALPAQAEWGSSWETGLRDAEDSSRPMLVYFHAADCEWSARLDRHWDDPEVQTSLESFINVRLDAVAHTNLALRERIHSLPTLLAVYPDHTVRRRHIGYPDRETLLAFLAEASQPPESPEPALDDAFEDRLRDLGISRDRSARLQAFLNETPFPSARLVEALAHPALQVRLGATEVLEARAGESFGYDPWIPPADQSAALLRWEEWETGLSDSDRPPTGAATAFTQRQVDGYVTELFSRDPERSRRALAMLMEGGLPVARHLRERESDDSALTGRERNLLRQARYAAVLLTWSAERPERLSRDLVFGDPGVRMRALGTLTGYAPRSLDLLQEFLRDPDPLVRESAVERLALAGGADSMPAIEAMWREETDTDVRVGILRAIGEIESQSTVALLTDALREESEDLIILAFDYLRHLSDFEHDTGVIGALLADPRWRVRAAALETVEQLRLTSLAPDVAERVRDEDEFVRLSALSALGRVGGIAQQPMLSELFLEDESVRLAVLGIYIQNDWPLPPEFANRLFESLPPGREAEFVSFLGNLRESQLSMARRFLDHPNEDFSIAATQSLAARGAGDENHRERLLALLKDGTRGQKLAVLRRFDPSSARLPRLGEDPDGRGSTASQGNILQRLFSGGSRDQSTRDDSPETRHPLAAFEQAAEAARSGGDEEVALEAAVFLTRIGSSLGIETLKDRIETLSSREIADLAESLSDYPDPHVVELLRSLFPRLESHSWGVVRSLFEHGSFADNLEFILAHAPDPVPTYFQRFLDDIPSYHRLTGPERQRTRTILRDTYEQSNDTALRVFVLVFWPQVITWEEDRSWILSQAMQPDPLVRRAALRLAVQSRPAILPELAAQIAGDSDYRVREVLPAAVQRNESWWSNQYSDAYSSSSWSNVTHTTLGTTSPNNERLPPSVEQPLREMTADPVRQLRLRALVALADIYETIENPETLTAHLDALESSDTDRFRVESWVSGFVYTHYRSMGPEHERLLRYVRNTGYPFNNFNQRLTIDNLRAHFRALREAEVPATEETPASEVVTAELRQEPAVTALRLPENGDQPATIAETAPNGTLPVIFFTQTGCADCAQVRDYLARLRPLFPEIEIHNHNIRDTSAIRLNEHLSETFQVPISNRLVVPTIVTAAGVLVRDEISLDSLNQLLGGSLGRDASVLTMPEQAVAAADARILERFHGFTFAVVLSAGLLDGLNPCAFATIIFFLSYLQVARRTPTQIMQVGVAFVLGVFIAYFAIGIGFYSLIGQLTTLEPVARAVNWILAGLVLVICILSIRDGILCLRGKLEETALQLPRPLKLRINALVRSGVKHSHFVTAAFLTGMAIALLELACTGQMYAPTIMLVLQSGAERLAAFGYLLVYNLAFILPLLIIILLAWRGLTSDRLMNFFRRNVAFVKFANATLFAVLFAFFVVVLL